jgi:hypothetical protein
MLRAGLVAVTKMVMGIELSVTRLSILTEVLYNGSRFLEFCAVFVFP